MRLPIFLLFTFLTSFFSYSQDDNVYFTTGFKIGDVTSSSAIVLARLCKDEKPVAITHVRKEKSFSPPIAFDDKMPIHQMDGAVQGVSGMINIELQSKDTLISSSWQRVSDQNDFILKRLFEGLQSNTKYTISIKGKKRKMTQISEVVGSFTTAPSADDAVPITFTSSTCQYFWSHDDTRRGFKIYDSMKKLKPSFHCQTGDFIYYDKPGPLATNVELARHKWHAMNAWPALKEFYMETPVYQQKDDHDLLKDDAGPTSTPYGELTYEEGLSIWREQVPIIGTPYRTVRWGKDLQIWSVEGREYRSDNKSPDNSEKTIWGKEQIAWFKKTVETSEATFKILVSPTPIVGPDRSKGKYDNHSNDSFATEGTWLRQYLADQNVFVINGDRHWQYVSVDPISGLHEFSQGPVSDVHAQGWNPEDKRPEHEFLRVKGGFLAVKVFRTNEIANIEFIHFDVDGNIVNTKSLKKPTLK